MNDLEVWIIIILVVGIIASNLAVLKYSAKFKMPQFGDPKPKSGENTDTSSTTESSSSNDASDKGSDKSS